MRPRAADLDDRLAKAIAHPLRHEVLAAIHDAGVMSPVQASAALGQPLGRVSHHVRVLLRLGAVELVRTRRRRGAEEHFYRATVLPWYDDSAWERLPLATRRAIFGSALDRLVTDMSAAIASTGFDGPSAHVSRIWLDLDDEGLGAIVELLADTLERIQAIKLETAARLAGTPPELRTELGVVHFERV